MSRELNRYWITEAGRAALAEDGHAPTCPIPCCTSPDDPNVAGLPGSALPAGTQPFYLTFGVHYARHPHPRGSWVHPEGWVTIVAPSYIEARRVAVDLFGICWSDLYDAESFAAEPLSDSRARFFPRGELLRVVVPAGLIETEDHRV